MFSKNFKYFIFLLSWFVTSSAWADNPIKQVTASSEKVPIQIKGGVVEYFHEQQKAVGTGGVSIDYEDVNLTADKITVYLATKRALAEGHVTLKQKGDVFKGERVEYDFEKKIGYVADMDAEIQSTYYGKAQRIEKLSDNHYRVIDSYVTTCCGEKPFYKIQSHEIDIYPNEKVVIKNAVMYIMQMPVIYIPYYVQYLMDYDRLPVQVAAGRRSEWGAFVLSKWRYNLIQQKDLSVRGNVLVDFREKRGLGIGNETFYSGEKIGGRGALRVYYADDNASPVNVQSARDRIQWRHQSKIGEATTLTTEFNKLSDAQVVKDFFYHDEYERDAFPDNYVSIITNKPEYSLSFLDRERINDFQSVVERSPEIRFDTHNRQLIETPFYLRDEVQFSNLRKRYADTSEMQHVTRLDNNYTLSYVSRVGPVAVVPHVGTRQTIFSRERDNDGALIRGLFDGGVDTSVRYYKTYDVTVKKFGLDYNQVRHIFAPTLSYFYRPNPTVSRTLLAQFDAIDAFDKLNFLRFGFENKLQTKSHAGDGTLYTRDLARIFPFTDFGLHTGRLTNLGIRGELYPYPWMGIQMDANYDPDVRNIDTANFDVYFNHDRWIVAIGQRYARDQSSQLTADIRYTIKDKWEFKVYERYEFKEGRSKEFEVTVSKYWDCIITDFIYNHRDGDSIMFGLRLKAFPSTPFRMSQSYNRPRPESTPERSL
jgi:lipopolysaccharide export system protein LptA